MHAFDLYDRLRREHGGTPFKKICADHDITVIKTPLEDSISAFLITVKTHRLIIVNSTLSRAERYGACWHEIYHALMGVPQTFDVVLSKREEQNADLFAAYCLAPVIHDGETADSLTERCHIPRRLAKLRIQEEVRRLREL